MSKNREHASIYIECVPEFWTKNTYETIQLLKKEISR